MNYNKVIIAGRLTRDPELKYSRTGTPIARVSMAINRKWKTETNETREEVTFLEVDLFGRNAENTAQYMGKGSAMLVEGRLKLDTWEDKQTGQQRSRLGIIGESVQFISDGQRREDSQPKRQPESRQEPVAEERDPDGDDNIPF